MIKCSKCETEVPILSQRQEKVIKWGGMLFSLLALIAIMLMFGYMYFNAEKIYNTPLVKAPCAICEDDQGYTCVRIRPGEVCQGGVCTRYSNIFDIIVPGRK